MAIDIIARGMAASLLNDQGKIDSGKMPIISAPTSSSTSFFPIGGLTDPSQVDGKTAEELLMAILYGVVNPTLIEPSFRVELLTDDTLVANQETVIEGNLIFDQGEIRAADGSVLPRTGDITRFIVDGREVYSATFSIAFTPVLGLNTITASVEFEEGAQPVDSLGNPYDVPYPAGALSIVIEIIGVYNIITAEGDPIVFNYFSAIDGEGYQCSFVTEALGVKQSFQVPVDSTVIGIKQFNTLSQSWEWIGGSPLASLATFDIEEKDGMMIYIHNGSMKGQRELRLYTSIVE